MPTVFASVSITILLFYVCTLGMAYAHLMPVGIHMLWGFFMTLLIVLLQCMIFGFFIGSGKSIKRVVAESGLGPEWIQKTRDYKNQTSPAIMLAILASIAAAGAGAGVATGSVSIWTHHLLILGALFLNARSLWVCYKVITVNVAAIHEINREIERRKEKGELTEGSRPIVEAPSRPPADPSASYYFLAVVVWVPFLYMRLSLGSRTFPFWPFVVASALFWVLGRVQALKSRKS